MEDLLTYSVIDFIPFSRDAYLKLFESVNETTWPLHIVLVLLALFCCLWGTRNKTLDKWLRALQTFVMAGFWIVLSFTFYRTYEQLNWAANYFSWAALAMAALILISISRLSAPTISKSWRLVLPIIAVFSLPILQLGFRSFQQLGWIGIAPLSTTIFTAAWIASRRRLAWWLFFPLGLFLCVECATFYAFYN